MEQTSTPQAERLNGRLYEVEVLKTLLVYATSEEEAIEVAKENEREEEGSYWSKLISARPEITSDLDETLPYTTRALQSEVGDETAGALQDRLGNDPAVMERFETLEALAASLMNEGETNG